MPKKVIKLLKDRKTPRTARRNMLLTLMDSYTMADIARAMGISRQRVHQLARGYTDN